MTLESIYYIGQTIAVVAILGSLVFVGLQIRDNSRAVRSATAQAVHDNYGAWYTALAGNEAALETSAKAFVDLDSLTPLEKQQFTCIFMAFLSHHQNAYYQWAAGHLSDGLWQGWEALMMNLVNTPGGAAFWAERCYVFGTEFQEHIATVMQRTPDPRAKAFGVVPLNEAGSREEVTG